MKNIKITAALLREFRPCYDPSEVMPEDEEITLKEAIIKYRNSVRKKDDVIWVLCRKEFMTDKEIRLFAVWCAREGLKLVESPDPRSIAACDVAERYANGEATDEELVAARDAARGAAKDLAWAAARAAAIDTARDAAIDTARDAAWSAAWAAARDAAWSAWSAASAASAGAKDVAWAADSDTVWDAQIDKLLTYFE